LPESWHGVVIIAKGIKRSQDKNAGGYGSTQTMMKNLQGFYGGSAPRSLSALSTAY